MRKTKDPRSVPRSLLSSVLISLRSVRSNFARVPCPPFTPRASSTILLSDRSASACSFCQVGCRGAGKDTERKRAKLARFAHPSDLPLSFSFRLCRSLLRSSLAAERWFVNAKFKLSRTALLEPSCDANEDTNTSTLSKSLLLPLVLRELPPKRRNEHTNETSGTRERGGTGDGISREF